MILFKHSEDLRTYLDKLKRRGLRLGFVPTMGALHSGHISLIERSNLEADVTVCSIYVNPVQFNNADDFKQYPVNIEADILLLEKNNCDILFFPDECEIYPDEASKKRHFEIGYLERILEGEFRPGHFQGVCMVVERLLNIVDPAYLYLGQKDYQQSLIIKKLARMLKKNISITICPTVREPNGLAMSSRNLRLTNDERDMAAELYKSLVHINNELSRGNLDLLKSKTKRKLEDIGFKIDYLEIARMENLEIIQNLESREGLIILIAAFLNNIRLIDNLIVTA